MSSELNTQNNNTRTLSLKPSSATNNACSKNSSKPQKKFAKKTINPEEIESRISQLAKIISQAENSVSLIKSTNERLSSISKLVGQANTVAMSAYNIESSAQEHSELTKKISDKYLTLLKQIDDAALNCGSCKINLLHNEELITYFDENQRAKIVTEPKDMTSNGLEIDNCNFSSSEETEQILDKLSSALLEIHEFSSTLTGDQLTIQTRIEFIITTTNSLRKQCHKAGDIADINEKDNLIKLGVSQKEQQEQQDTDSELYPLASETQQRVLNYFKE